MAMAILRSFYKRNFVNCRSHNMLVYFLKRILLATVTLFIILMVSYLLLRLAPGDPTRSTVFGSDASASQLSSDKANAKMNSSMREKLYLDEPVYVGFYFWLKNALRGDFGTSITVDPGKPVFSVIIERLPITLKLNLWSILLTYILAITVGVFAAMKPTGFFDRSSTFILFLLYSLPVIWVALVLQSLLCKGGMYPIFPVRGVTPPTVMNQAWHAGIWEQMRYFILPVVCLTYGGFAGLSRYTRAGMIEVLGQEYIRTAKAKGVASGKIVFVHALRNTLITLITLFSGILPGLVAGSIIVEQIFGIPGMGSLSLLSLSSRDYPLQMALFSFVGGLTLSGILISDLLYMLADPRITLANKK